MFKSARDAMAGRAAQSYVNELIARYGKVRDLRIDSQRKTISVACDLMGEPSPITIEVDEYELVPRDGKQMFRIVSCRCSRPWLENLLHDHVRGRGFPLPNWAALAL